MINYIFGLLLMFLIGCTTPQDHTPPPINHNQMTLELQACGQQEVGLAGCFYKEDLTEKLVVPLWHKGEYQVKSERCNFLENKRYEGSQKLELTYAELLAQKPDSDDGCLYNIKVFIDGFDNGFEGFFTLAKGDIKAIAFDFRGKSYVGYAGLQLKEGETPQDVFTFAAETPGELIFEGCQKQGAKRYTNRPRLLFSEVLEGTVIPKASCILTVGLIPDDESLPVEYGKIHINVYEKTVVQLPQPALQYKNEKLTVRADKIVAGIGIGDHWSIKRGSRGKKATRDVAEDEEVEVRIATSNGRFMLLKVKNGEVLWIK